MAACPNCGFREFGLALSQCYVCGRRLCKRCAMAFGISENLVYKNPNPWAYDPGGWQPQPVQYASCSWDCFDRWAWTFISRNQAPVLAGQTYDLGGIHLYPGPAARALKIYEDSRRRNQTDLAQKLLQAEDYEGAARVYQDLGLWKEAGDARRQGRHVVTEVQVNLNDLIEQLRKAGITTDYTCPACGSHIRISGETSLTTLTSCEHCGSVIQTTDLVDFLAKVVGYR